MIRATVSLEDLPPLGGMYTYDAWLERRNTHLAKLGFDISKPIRHHSETENFWVTHYEQDEADDDQG